MRKRIFLVLGMAILGISVCANFTARAEEIHICDASFEAILDCSNGTSAGYIHNSGEQGTGTASWELHHDQGPKGYDNQNGAPTLLDSGSAQVGPGETVEVVSWYAPGDKLRLTVHQDLNCKSKDNAPTDDDVCYIR